MILDFESLPYLDTRLTDAFEQPVSDESGLVVR